MSIATQVTSVIESLLAVIVGLLLRLLVIPKDGITGGDCLLLRYYGPAYISKELREYLEEREISHTRGKPYHPQTQGKIERYHRTLKNLVTLQHYYVPWELEREIKRFVHWYNHERYHESLDNLTPADVYHSRSRELLTARELLKMQTLERRRCYNLGMKMRKETLIRPAELRECVY
jgi:hypothetical protein